MLSSKLLIVAENKQARYRSESILFYLRNFALRSDAVSSTITTRCSGGLARCGKTSRPLWKTGELR
jgi:hypothetical protein